MIFVTPCISIKVHWLSCELCYNYSKLQCFWLNAALQVLDGRIHFRSRTSLKMIAVKSWRIVCKKFCMGKLYCWSKQTDNTQYTVAFEVIPSPALKIHIFYAKVHWIMFKMSTWTIAAKHSINIKCKQYLLVKQTQWIYRTIDCCIFSIFIFFTIWDFSSSFDYSLLLFLFYTSWRLIHYFPTEITYWKKKKNSLSLFI